MPKGTAGTDTALQGLIDLANAGDPASREALLDHACDRLLRLTRKIFHCSGDLCRWEETADVFQSSMMRLHRALASTKVESVRHFFNLAALQIRRELIDLARHHFGPEGIGLERRIRVSQSVVWAISRQSTEPPSPSTRRAMSAMISTTEPRQRSRSRFRPGAGSTPCRTGARETAAGQRPRRRPPVAAPVFASQEPCFPPWLSSLNSTRTTAAV